jgi:hypothetical protein
MRKFIVAVLKVIAAFAIATAAWFPFGGIMWKTDTVGTADGPATQSHLGSVVFIVLFIAALSFAFRRRKDASNSNGQVPGTET